MSTTYYLKGMITLSYFTNYICCYPLDFDNTLLLNTLTSAIDIVDNKTFKKIENMMKGQECITSKSDPELFSKLKTRGYIFDSKNEENQIIDTLKHINQKSSLSVIPTKFIICPTMGCNLRCTYCFEGNDQHTDFKLMSDDQLNIIFEFIINCLKRFNEKYKDVDHESLSYKREFPQISLFGGEPLLKCNYAIVEKILNFASKTHVPVGIITNGTTLDDDYEKLIKKYSDVITVVQITIDGDKEIHDSRRIRANGSGTFDEICDGIDKFLRLGLKINLRINLDKSNIEHLYKLKKVFDERGWSSNPLFLPYASPVKCYTTDVSNKEVLTDSEILDVLMEKGWYGNEDSFLSTVLSPVFGIVTNFFRTPGDQVKPWKKTYCEGTYGAQYCFTPNGKITTCLTCVSNPKYSIGTFDKDGVKIDNLKLEKWTGRNAFAMDKCKRCKFALLCGGGCPVQSLECYGNINCAVCDDVENTLKVFIKHKKIHF